MDEAPCPSPIDPIFSSGETPRPFYEQAYDEKDRKISEGKSVEIEFKNSIYIFNLGISENNKYIIFKISPKKGLHLSSFTAYINFNQFNNINSLFSFYNNLKEIYNLLIKYMEEKKFSISLDKDKYKITFNFLMPGDIIVNVDFYLKEEKVNGTMILDDIYNIVDKLEEENKKFKEEINKLKNEDNKLKENLDVKNKEIMNLKNEMKEIKKENESIKEKLKIFEDNLNKISNNINNIKNENNYNNKNKNGINPNSESDYKSIPNRFNNLNNDNNKPKQIQRNIIIDEDEEENNFSIFKRR